MEIPQDQLEAFLRVAAAAGLAGLLGLERELRDKPAGFRTHMIVGGAAALLLLLGTHLLEHYEESAVAGQLRADPLRIVEAIIVGISFIGAGVILKVEEKNRIRNLTTAATILCSATIGIAVAVDLFYLAIGVTALFLIITAAVNWIERILPGDRS